MLAARLDAGSCNRYGLSDPTSAVATWRLSSSRSVLQYLRLEHLGAFLQATRTPADETNHRKKDDVIGESNARSYRLTRNVFLGSYIP